MLCSSTSWVIIYMDGIFVIEFFMRHACTSRFIRFSLVCALAIAANLLVMLFRYLLWSPLFVDTVFTVAVTFALGLIPGFVVAVLTWAADGVMGFGLQPFHPFLLVAIAEVFLVHTLKPKDTAVAHIPQDPASGIRNSAMLDRKMFAISSVFARLILVYFVCVIAASVLGGLIDLVHHTLWGVERP